MAFNLYEDAKTLYSLGVTIKDIKNELKQRGLPEQDLLYFGANKNNIPTEEQSMLFKYSKMQLQKLIEIIASREQDNRTEAIIHFSKEDKKMKKSNNIYDEIKEKLDSCNSIKDYEDAYKWLANQFVEVNESAVRFENKFIDKYGEAEFGALIYGSKEAYEAELNFNKRINEATTDTEKMMVLLDKVTTPHLISEDEELPVLWEDDKEEDDFELPYAQ